MSSIYPNTSNISPGVAPKFVENASKFSKTLVREWLFNINLQNESQNYRFFILLQIREKQRAKDIADQLCKHSDWLTHGRSVKIEDLEKMGLKITNYELNSDLNDAITRYYTLLQITLESTNIYKLFETTETQIMRFATPNVDAIKNNKPTNIIVNFECPKCKSKYDLQARLKEDVPVDSTKIPFPKNDIFVCPKCATPSNISQARLQIEAQTGSKIVS